MNNTDTIVINLETVERQHDLVFDDRSKFYSTSPAHNRLFLYNVRDNARTQLLRNRHLFLNDLLKALGFRPTPVGAITGWVFGEDVADYFSISEDEESGEIDLKITTSGVIFHKI